MKIRTNVVDPEKKKKSSRSTDVPAVIKNARTKVAPDSTRVAKKIIRTEPQDGYGKGHGLKVSIQGERHFQNQRKKTIAQRDSMMQVVDRIIAMNRKNRKP